MPKSQGKSPMAKGKKEVPPIIAAVAKKKAMGGKKKKQYQSPGLGRENSTDG